MDAPEIAAVQTDQEAKELLGETLQGIPVNYELAREFANISNSSWMSGMQAGNSLIPLICWGLVPWRLTQNIHYTKPILVLVNRLDFSGDFFPAILQDNKRALIMGSPTAGAGGYVNKVVFPNMNGISYFSYTVSMAERKNSQPIENLGVAPDIYYEITENDLASRYEEYSEAILKVVDTMVESKNSGKERRKKPWKSRLSKR